MEPKSIGTGSRKGFSRRRLLGAAVCLVCCSVSGTTEKVPPLKHSDHYWITPGWTKRAWKKK